MDWGFLGAAVAGSGSNNSASSSVDGGVEMDELTYENQRLAREKASSDGRAGRMAMRVGEAFNEIDRLKEQLAKADTTGLVAELQEKLKIATEHAEKLKTEVEEKEREILKQKEVLREWMVSQMAFKNLFKKYGKLPNGSPVTSLNNEERVKMVEKENGEALIELMMAEENEKRRVAASEREGREVTLSKTMEVTREEIIQEINKKKYISRLKS